MVRLVMLRLEENGQRMCWAPSSEIWYSVFTEGKVSLCPYLTLINGQAAAHLSGRKVSVLWQSQISGLSQTWKCSSLCWWKEDASGSKDNLLIVSQVLLHIRSRYSVLISFGFTIPLPSLIFSNSSEVEVFPLTSKILSPLTKAEAQLSIQEA